VIKIIINWKLLSSFVDALSPDYLRFTNESLLWSTTRLTWASGDRDFLASTVKNLKKRLNTLTHADVEVSLGALDVIVQVVTEGQNDIACGFTLGRSIVTGLENEGSITVSARADTSKLGWRILKISIAGRSTLDVLAEFVKEHMTKDDIISIIKVDGEDHSDTITVLLEPNRFVGTIVDLNDLATSSTLRSLVHHLVKNRSKKVAGHARSKTSKLCSFSLRVDLDGDADGDIILWLRGNKKAAINLLEIFLTTVGLDLIPAFAGNRNVQFA